MKCNNCGKENPEQARFCEYCGEDFLNSNGVCMKQTYRYCVQCGKPMGMNEKICSFCGTKEIEKEDNNNEKLMWKIFVIIIGLVGCIYSIVTMVNDIDTYNSTWHFGGYNYKEPLNEHEAIVLLILFISIIVLLIGLCMSSKKTSSKSKN